MSNQPLSIIHFADHHMHLTSAEVAQKMTETLSHEILGDFKPRLCSADQMIAALDKAGIQKAIALSNAYQWGMDFLNPGGEEYEMVRFENDFTAHEAEKYPQRLMPFLSVHPLKEYAIPELERCVHDLGLQGLKLHFTNSNVDLRQAEHVTAIWKLLSHAEKLNLPVLIHFLSRNPLFGADDVNILMNEVVAKLPGLKLQMAHLGCGGLTKTMIEVFEAFIVAFEANPALNKERIFLDIAACISDGSKPLTQALNDEQAAQITEQMRRWGIGNILWGTDWPIFEPLEYVEMVHQTLGLNEQEFETMQLNEGLIA